MIVNFHNIELETSEDSFRPTLISEECALNADFINKTMKAYLHFTFFAYVFKVSHGVLPR